MQAPSADFHYRDGKLYCDRVAVEEVVGTLGTPLYIYSRAGIVKRFREFRTAFAPLDPLIAYSVKANGNVSILRLLGQEGAGADIVSGGELYRVRAAGIPADRVVFSGVGKTVTELTAALEAGIYGFNVESEGELRALASLGETMGMPAPVALRVNPDIESPTPHAYTRTGHRTTKFGIATEDALRLYRAAARLPGIELRGVDVHIGSQIVEVDPYRRALEHVLALVEQLRRDGIELEYIDLGGGFGVSYEGETSTPARVFGQALAPRVAESGLRLVLEPGRYIVAPAGALLTRVLYVKEMGGKTFVITDAGMNDLLRPSHYASYHHVAPVAPHPEREQVVVDIVGPVCESGDFLALDRRMELPSQGELLAVGMAGAYGFSMASTYNARPRPAEVLVDGDQYRVIRRRETYEELVRGEVATSGLTPDA